MIKIYGIMSESIAVNAAIALGNLGYDVTCERCEDNSFAVEAGWLEAGDVQAPEKLDS